MRKTKKILSRFFLTADFATTIFGEELVAMAKKYRLFKKNLRVRVEDLVALAVLADASLSAQKVSQLMTALPECFRERETISPTELQEWYAEFREKKLPRFPTCLFYLGKTSLLCFTAVQARYIARRACHRQLLREYFQ